MAVARRAAGRRRPRRRVRGSSCASCLPRPSPLRDAARGLARPPRVLRPRLPRIIIISPRNKARHLLAAAAPPSRTLSTRACAAQTSTWCACSRTPLRARRCARACMLCPLLPRRWGRARVKRRSGTPILDLAGGEFPPRAAFSSQRAPLLAPSLTLSLGPRRAGNRCLQWCRWAGIRRAYWTDANGEWKGAKVAQLLEEGDVFVTRSEVLAHAAARM